MTDSLDLGPDGQLNQALALLRGDEKEGALSDRMDFAAGVTLRADPALELGGRYASPAGQLIAFEAEVAGRGGWCGLHLGLPARDLSDRGMLGFACRSAAPEIRVIQPCLRSGTADGFEDCFFDKHILSQPEESSHVDILPVGRRARFPVEAPWRELILFLPLASFRWSLIDLRVFVI
jgi:hypothetical protein